MKINNKNMRTFYIIWFGQLVSTLGSGLTGYALGVWLYQETNSVFLFSTNIFVYAGTSLLVTPFAGALVDRWNRRLVMILSDAGAGLSTLAVFFLFSTGRMEFWHIYVLGAFNAAFTAFQFPAHSAATTMIVPKEQPAKRPELSITEVGEDLDEELEEDLIEDIEDYSEEEFVEEE